MTDECLGERGLGCPFTGWKRSDYDKLCRMPKLSRKPADNYTPEERSIFKGLSTPEKIQRFFDDGLRYDAPAGPIACRSPRQVLRDRSANCMEGAMFGAAALRMLGHPPLLVDLVAVNDDDHVIAVFRINGHWGAISKSDYSGLRFREPAYRTVRELVMSYFEHYYNQKREKTLRKYSRPVNLSRFDSIQWMTSEDNVWEVPDHLCSIPHIPLLRRGLARRLSLVDDRTFAAGLLRSTATHSTMQQPSTFPATAARSDVPLSTLPHSVVADNGMALSRSRGLK